MSNILNVPRGYKQFTTSLTVNNTTLGKILVDCQAPAVVAAISGETALPGESSVRQRILEGGVRIIGGSISSTDGTARSILIYIGECLTTQDTTNTGVLALTTGSITRVNGSFITDGWKIGDAVMVFGPTTAPNVGSATAGNTGLILPVATVAAGTLTVPAASFTADAALPAGARLFRVALRTRRAVAITAGYADATPAVALLGGTQDPATASLPDAGWELGAANALIVAMVANISAIPARIDIMAEGALR